MKARRKIFQDSMLNSSIEIKQKNYQELYKSTQKKPYNIKASHDLLPHNRQLQRQNRIPISFFFKPICDETQYIAEFEATKIPRCSNCGAYYNCFNTQVNQESFKCILCGYTNQSKEFKQNYKQIKQSITEPTYQTAGDSDFYQCVPPENALILMIDISYEAYESSMLEYGLQVIQNIIEQGLRNDDSLFIYTYNDMIHEYNFEDTEVKQIIFDPSIKICSLQRGFCYVRNVKDKWSQFSKYIIQTSKMSKKNSKGCFSETFDHVLSSSKHTGSRIIILHAQQSLSLQNMFTQSIKGQSNKNQSISNIFQSTNATFFDKYASILLTNNISIEMFVFSQRYKNLKVLNDTFKITNSKLYLYEYNKQAEQFYYDLYKVMSRTDYADVRTKIQVNNQWDLVGVYGNNYKIPNKMQLKFCHLDPAQQVTLCFLPSQGLPSLPYFAMQIQTNYFYDFHNYLAISTILTPLTNQSNKIYQSINEQVISAAYVQQILSKIRILQKNKIQNQMLREAAYLYKSWNNSQIVNRNQQILKINVILESIFSMLKSSYLNIPTVFSNSYLLDKLLVQRLYIQFSTLEICKLTISPYLFDIGNIKHNMCLAEEFIYPDLVPLQTARIYQGIFLMDTGIALYLYISQKLSSQKLSRLLKFETFKLLQINKNKLELGQKDLSTQSYEGQQLSTLIITLRQYTIVNFRQKQLRWLPLHIICQHLPKSKQYKQFLSYFRSQSNKQLFYNFNYSWNAFFQIISKWQ